MASRAPVRPPSEQHHRAVLGERPDNGLPLPNYIPSLAKQLESLPKLPAPRRSFAVIDSPIRSHAMRSSQSSSHRHLPSSSPDFRSRLASAADENITQLITIAPPESLDGFTTESDDEEVPHMGSQNAGRTPIPPRKSLSSSRGAIMGQGRLMTPMNSQDMRSHPIDHRTIISRLPTPPPSQLFSSTPQRPSPPSRVHARASPTPPRRLPAASNVADPSPNPRSKKNPRLVAVTSLADLRSTPKVPAAQTGSKRTTKKATPQSRPLGCLNEPTSTATLSADHTLGASSSGASQSRNSSRVSLSSAKSRVARPRKSTPPSLSRFIAPDRGRRSLTPQILSQMAGRDIEIGVGDTEVEGSPGDDPLLLKPESDDEGTSRSIRGSRTEPMPTNKVRGKGKGRASGFGAEAVKPPSTAGPARVRQGFPFAPYTDAPPHPRNIPRWVPRSRKKKTVTDQLLDAAHAEGLIGASPGDDSFNTQLDDDEGTYLDAGFGSDVETEVGSMGDAGDRSMMDDTFMNVLARGPARYGKVERTSRAEESLTTPSATKSDGHGVYADEAPSVHDSRDGEEEQHLPSGTAPVSYPKTHHDSFRNAVEVAVSEAEESRIAVFTVARGPHPILDQHSLSGTVAPSLPAPARPTFSESARSSMCSTQIAESEGEITLDAIEGGWSEDGSEDGHDGSDRPAGQDKIAQQEGQGLASRKEEDEREEQASRDMDTSEQEAASEGAGAEPVELREADAPDLRNAVQNGEDSGGDTSEDDGMVQTDLRGGEAAQDTGNWTMNPSDGTAYGADRNSPDHPANEAEDQHGLDATGEDTPAAEPLENFYGAHLDVGQSGENDSQLEAAEEENVALAAHDALAPIEIAGIDARENLYASSDAIARWSQTSKELRSENNDTAVSEAVVVREVQNGDTAAAIHSDAASSPGREGDLATTVIQPEPFHSAEIMPLPSAAARDGPSQERSGLIAGHETAPAASSSEPAAVAEPPQRPPRTDGKIVLKLVHKGYIKIEPEEDLPVEEVDGAEEDADLAELGTGRDGDQTHEPTAAEGAADGDFEEYLGGDSAGDIEANNSFHIEGEAGETVDKEDAVGNESQEEDDPDSTRSAISSEDGDILDSAGERQEASLPALSAPRSTTPICSPPRSSVFTSIRAKPPPAILPTSKATAAVTDHGAPTETSKPGRAPKDESSTVGLAAVRRGSGTVLKPSRLRQQVVNSSPSISPEKSAHAGDEDLTLLEAHEASVLEESPFIDEGISIRSAGRSLLQELARADGSRGAKTLKNVVEVSSLDPRAAARAAAILKLNHNYIEHGFHSEPSSSTAVPATPRTAGRSRRKSYTSRHFDSLEASRRLTKEELLNEAELEIVVNEATPGRREREGTAFSAVSHISGMTDMPLPGGWIRTPKRKHTELAPVPFELDNPPVASHWGVAEWKRLEKVYRAEKQEWIKEREVKSMPGGLLGWARRSTGIGMPYKEAREWDDARVVDKFLADEGADNQGGDWARDVIALRVKALERRVNEKISFGSTALQSPTKRQRLDPVATPVKASESLAEQTPAHLAPPSTIKRVMNWVWGSRSAGGADVRTNEEVAPQPLDDSILEARSVYPTLPVTAPRALSVTPLQVMKQVAQTSVTPAVVSRTPLPRLSGAGYISALGLDLSTASTATTAPPVTPHIRPHHTGPIISQRSAAIKSLFPAIHPLGDSTSSTISTISGDTSFRSETSAAAREVSTLRRNSSVKDLVRGFEDSGSLAGAMQKRASRELAQVEGLHRVRSAEKR